MSRSKTSTFGVSKREGHDSNDFYNRRLYSNRSTIITDIHRDRDFYQRLTHSNWIDKIFNQSSIEIPIPDNSIDLVFTSPPYNVGKEYDQNLTLEEYLNLIRQVNKEVYRVLKPGGKYVINIANVGRKPYISLVSEFYNVQMSLGFLSLGEIIWQKSRGASGSCAWGSWMSASSPVIRDVHEYLLIFAKESYSRQEKGVSDISRDEFMSSTLSIWNIPPERASRIGHPAPFPIALAERVIHLYSYVGDIVLDPFVGSGTTCVAAKKNNRHFVGIEISTEYCKLSQTRLEKV